MAKKKLVVIVGPTAVGKTSIGIEVAKHLNAEIVSADSRQFYRETEIGTAKPSPEELKAVKHHFIDTLSIKEDYNAGAYERDCLVLLEKLFNESDFVVMVGGSGLYVKAVAAGIDDMPAVDMKIRDQLNLEHENLGLSILLEELEKSDPEYYEEVDKQNHIRIIRALEIIRTTGQPFSSFRNRPNKTVRPFDIIQVGLELPREVLYDRIDRRMDLMIDQGLFDEAEKLFQFRHLNALQTVGYSEIFDFMEGKYDREEAIRLLKRNSRRYAKRQFTWFKKDEKTRWFSPGQFNDILDYIERS